MTGIDVSPKMLAVLRSKRRDIDVMFAEAARPPLLDGAFNAALFVHILHLVPDPEATVRAAIKLVRPGGLIIEGRDDRITGLRDQADVMVRETVKELSGVEMVDWAPYERGTQLVERCVSAAGGSIERITVAKWSNTTTSRKVIELIERRDYSISWAITDEMLPAVLERVTPRIVELFGGMDAAIEAPRSFSLTVGRLP
jgi:SAM-dependent methyltransferase